jgi:hypothetical protein
VFVRLNLDARLRAAPKDRAETVDIQLKNGSMTINEARALEDRPPVDWGDSPSPQAPGDAGRRRPTTRPAARFVAETVQKLYLGVPGDPVAGRGPDDPQPRRRATHRPRTRTRFASGPGDTDPWRSAVTLLHVLERRQAKGTVEFRAAEGDDGTPVLEGYAAVFNRWSVDLGGFRERIAPGAFTKTVREADVVALWNHDDGHLLGRIASGTLTLQGGRPRPALPGGAARHVHGTGRGRTGPPR